MTEYIDKTISILEEATKHLSNDESMLCAMAIGRAIATLDAQRCATSKPLCGIGRAADMAIETSYLFKKDTQSPYQPLNTVQVHEPARTMEASATPVPEEEGDDEDLSNITIEDLKEFSKMKKLMASMEIIDAMKSRISGFCSKVSENMRGRLRTRRTPHTNLFITYL